jgi:CRISPR-associated endonuclease Cas2
MSRPKRKVFSLREKLAAIAKAGIREVQPDEPADDKVLPLHERLQQILQIVKSEPTKANEMTYLIMYDISNNKVRTQIAKYLLKQGCIRIQKSVFMVKSTNDRFQDIHKTLKEVNSYYDNEDSIILVPINTSDVRSMKLIGKNVQIETITDRPNTLFF